MSEDLFSRPSICGVVEGFYGRPWTFNQRKDLFTRMRALCMNTYIYAPKDDMKHRQMWRELYTAEEMEQLKTLTDAATQNDVMFVYAISPGLDITFSNQIDVNALKNKMKQVMEIGCNAFAILFDDIDPNLNVTDKEKFESLAVAQVTLTNDLYKYLDKPKFFLFCPTEYCATRAVPSVRDSEYLNTVGSYLEPNIDIMWTGPKVISKSISEASIEELNNVLHRCPVIWDNLHANDYDQKRLFLGPYCGRSAQLLKKLRGVVTNPNCEFEANFIAVHTLASWFNKSLIQIGLSSNQNNPSNFIEYDPKKSLEDALVAWMRHLYKTSSDSYLQVLPPIKSVTQALMATAVGSLPPATANIAAVATASHLLSSPPSPGPPLNMQAANGDVNQLTPVHDIMQQQSTQQPNVALAAASIVQHAAQEEAMEICESEYIQVVQQEMIQNIQQDADIDKSGLENGPNDKKDDNMQMQVDENISESMEVSSEADTNQAQVTETSGSSQTGCKDEETAEASQTTDIVVDGLSQQDMLTMDNLRLLVDLYYLPYEHGGEGVKMLELVHWLRSHAHLVDRDDQLSDQDITNNSSDVSTASTIECANQPNKQSSMTSNSMSSLSNGPINCQSNELKTTHWRIKAAEFHNRVQQVRDLINRFCCITNKSVLSDFYSYLQDMRHILESLDSYIKWLESAKITYKNVSALRRLLSWCTPGYKEMFTGDDYESWMFRGGLIAEFQRMFPIDNAYDIYPVRASFVIYNPSSVDFSVNNLISPESPLSIEPPSVAIATETNSLVTAALSNTGLSIANDVNTTISQQTSNTTTNNNPSGIVSSSNATTATTTASISSSINNGLGGASIIQRAAPSLARSTSYNVRPYNLADRPSLYKLCFDLFSSRNTVGGANSSIMINWLNDELLCNLPGDRYIGAYLDFCPQYCLVLENEDGIVIGYACGCVDINSFDNYRINQYNLMIREKYSKYLLKAPGDEFNNNLVTDPFLRAMLQYFVEDRRPIIFTENSVLAHIDIREHCKPYDLDTIDSLLRKLFICIVSAFKTATAETNDINYPASLLTTTTNNSTANNNTTTTTTTTNTAGVASPTPVTIVKQATLITTNNNSAAPNNTVTSNVNEDVTANTAPVQPTPAVPMVTIVAPVVQVIGANRDRAPLISLRMYAEIDQINKNHKEMYKRYGFTELENTGVTSNQDNGAAPAATNTANTTVNSDLLLNSSDNVLGNTPPITEKSIPEPNTATDSNNIGNSDVVMVTDDNSPVATDPPTAPLASEESDLPSNKQMTSSSSVSQQSLTIPSYYYLLSRII